MDMAIYDAPVLDRPRVKWVRQHLKETLGSAFLSARVLDRPEVLRTFPVPFIFVKNRENDLNLFVFDPDDKMRYGVRAFKAVKSLRPHLIVSAPTVVPAPNAYPKGTYVIVFPILECNLRLMPMSDKSAKCVAIAV